MGEFEKMMLELEPTVRRLEAEILVRALAPTVEKIEKGIKKQKSLK